MLPFIDVLLVHDLTQLHSERLKLYGVLAVLSAIWLKSQRKSKGQRYLNAAVERSSGTPIFCKHTINLLISMRQSCSVFQLLSLFHKREDYNRYLQSLYSPFSCLFLCFNFQLFCLSFISFSLLDGDTIFPRIQKTL